MDRLTTTNACKYMSGRTSHQPFLDLLPHATSLSGLKGLHRLPCHSLVPWVAVVHVFHHVAAQKSFQKKIEIWFRYQYPTSHNISWVYCAIETQDYCAVAAGGAWSEHVLALVKVKADASPYQTQYCGHWGWLCLHLPTAGCHEAIDKNLLLSNRIT
jgi:hypothetical protein